MTEVEMAGTRGAPVQMSLSGLDDERRSAFLLALGLCPGPVPDDGAVTARARLVVLRHEAEEHPLLLSADELPRLSGRTATALELLTPELAEYPTGATAAPPAGVLVRPGDEESADRLLREAFPAMAPRTRRQVLARTVGSPLALLEPGAGGDTVRPSPGGTLPKVVPLLEGIEALVTARLTRLPATTRDALLMAALAGDGDTHVPRRPGGLAAWTVLRAAETAKLVEVDHEAHRVIFRHPLIRSAVVASSTHVERRRAHRALADLVSDPERRAWHLAEASVAPDETVAGLLEQAARRATHRGDATDAVAALVRAAHLSPRPAERSRRLAAAAYLGAGASGELDSAADLLRQARTIAPENGGALHAAAAAALLLVEGDGVIETAHRLVVDAIEEGSHGYDATDGELIDALSTLLTICWWAGREEFWPPLLEAIDRLVPEPPHELLLLRQAFPDPARAPARTRQRVAELIRRQDATSHPDSLLRVNTAATYLDLLADGRAGARRLIHSGRTGGAAAGALAGFMHLCLDDFVTGRWEEGRRLAAEGLALAKAHGYEFTSWYFLFHTALLGAVRGDATAWTACADELTRVTVQRRAHGAARYAHHVRALGAIGRGDFEAAYHHACDLSPAGTLTPYNPHALWVALDLVESAVRTNRREQAEAHVRAMRAAGPEAVSPRLSMLTRAARALVAPDTEALLLFQEAIDSPGARDWPFDHARVRLLYGERLRRLRRVAEGRHHLRAAWETFERLGAAPWAARSAEELRAAGRPWPGTAADPTPSAGLTAQETKIALLAAEGLSNKQIGELLFLSPRTVGTHLYRLFPKLRVSSRAALRDALTRRLAGSDADPGS
ncbi:LuxR C-terminal-related transcriptional regulator [Streptomyces sp. NPDC017673]|uniref:LuxR C-terminal-related transcriptional regulator n=1 Tax=unclassified Streptomyces TaxID=2593676 RepID=UPI0037A99AAB